MYAIDSRVYGVSEGGLVIPTRIEQVTFPRGIGGVGGINQDPASDVGGLGIT